MVTYDDVVLDVNTQKGQIHRDWIRHKIDDETYKRKLKALDNMLDLVKKK